MSVYVHVFVCATCRCCCCFFLVNSISFSRSFLRLSNSFACSALRASFFAFAALSFLFFFPIVGRGLELSRRVQTKLSVRGASTGVQLELNQTRGKPMQKAPAYKLPRHATATTTRRQRCSPRR